MIAFSVLDLATVCVDGSPRQAFQKSVAIAQKAESLGFKRFWLAEHHNMIGVASAATAVLIGHVASQTKTIRVGSGGIMLPNHSPLVIAEQFGTLASLYPGRIDLGLGRAAGTDVVTTRALRRDGKLGADSFPDDVQELQGWFAPAEPGQAIQAVPGAGLDVPIWILGSSLFGARLAAAYGLPFAFAAHFAPQDMQQALAIYRSEFRPSAQLRTSYAMVGINLLAAETDDEANYQFTSQLQMFIALRRGTPGKSPPPLRDMETYWRPGEKPGVLQMLAASFVGSGDTVERKLRAFITDTKVDELILTSHIYDQPTRHRSLEIAAGIRDRINANG